VMYLERSLQIKKIKINFFNSKVEVVF
jgi:hypothetical protein